MWSGADTASAAPLPPPDVQEFFDEQTSDVIAESSEIASADRVGAAHELFTWTPAFLAGQDGVAPVETLDEWVSPLYAGDAIVGTISVFRPSPEAPAELAGYSADVAFGAAVGAIGDGTVLVTDPPSGSLYALTGEMLVPLNDAALSEMRTSMTVHAFQRIVSPRYAQDIAESDTAPDLTIPIVLSGLVVALAIGTGVAIAVRRRRV